MPDLARHLAPDRVVFLRSRTKEDALRELVATAAASVSALEPGVTLDAVLEREQLVSSWVGPGVAIPHARLPGLGGFVMALGRSEAGIDYGSPDGQPVHLVFLILGDAAEPDRHLMLLADVARLLREPGVRRELAAAERPRAMLEAIRRFEAAPPGAVPAEGRRMSEAVFDCAVQVARAVDAEALLFDADVLATLAAADPGAFGKVVAVVHEREPYGDDLDRFGAVVELPFPSLGRAGHVEVSILVAVSKGILHPGERVVSVSGRPGSGHFDTIRLIDVGADLPMLNAGRAALPLGDVEPQVLERVLQLAVDIGREGREGKPVGALFVVGALADVLTHGRQMIMNPFHGYADAEKSILDPSLEETVKEFATLDGAFVLRGDGVLVAAGMHLHPDLPPERVALEVPPGLGARHAAGAAITVATGALAVVVSQSTGNVSLFLGGRLALTLQKGR